MAPKGHQPTNTEGLELVETHALGGRKGKEKVLKSLGKRYRDRVAST